MAKAAAKAGKAPSKPRKASASARKGRSKTKPVKLLAGGNPQIAKGDGDAPVQAYIAAMPGWKRDVGRRIDAIITKAVQPQARLRKAVKWNSPMYGIEGLGWIVGIHCMTKYVKVAFLNGAALRPLPPEESKQEKVRYLHIHETDTIDDVLLMNWVKQASKLAGWITSDIK